MSDDLYNLLVANVFVAVGIAYLVLWKWRSFLRYRNGVWHLHQALPWQKMRFLDGTTQRGGSAMRRFYKGAWQYRSLTDEERSNENQLKAW